MRWMVKRTTVVVICALAVTLSGCPGKKTGPGTGADDGTGTGAYGEEGLSGSSLDRARSGKRPEEDGILKDVHFGYDSAEVDSSERDRLEQNVAWLRENPRAKVELEGHCDSRGTIDYNLGLGAKRAKTVKDFLMGQGIGAERVSTISYGKELPLCQDESDDCWARNRRVHFVILK